MCRLARCQTCNKPTWIGCGAHIEDVMKDIDVDRRCVCGKEDRKPIEDKVQDEKQKQIQLESPSIKPMQSFFSQSFGASPAKEELGLSESDLKLDEHKKWLLRCIGRSIIGYNKMIPGPYRPLRLLYADYTASGRSLEFIEQYISEEVLPMYANTHTEASGTGRQTTQFREEARKIIGDEIGGNDDDAIIFCGSGCTAAVNKILHILNLRLPKDLDAKYGFKKMIPQDQRPVVMIGPYEHHSNELPWRESIADVIVIAESSDGHVCLSDLRQKLAQFKDRPLIIGSFSAASNVTGILTDVSAVTLLLHSFGALAFWDYAAAAPYIGIDMNPSEFEGEKGEEVIKSWSNEQRALWDVRPYKSTNNPYALDAVFMSPHKFLGGPNTTGVLACKRLLVESGVPDSPGGGTVLFVNPGSHDYLSNPEAREEAGTPDIIGSIRAGLVFQLKAAVGVETIWKAEDAWLNKVFEKWAKEPLIRILGNTDARRLGIVSFMIREPPHVTEMLAARSKPKSKSKLCCRSEKGSSIGRYLHHNFVTALLNDVFGIQARGGCSCAGPLGHRVLNMSPDVSMSFRELRRAGVNGITPGWARLSFHYVFTEKEVDFLIDAVLWIAREGWKLAPDYNYDPISGLWTHRFGHPELESSLHDISYLSGVAEYCRRHASGIANMMDQYIGDADALLEQRVGEMKSVLNSKSEDGEGAEVRPSITKHVEIVDSVVIQSIVGSSSSGPMILKGPSWLRLTEEERKTSVFVCGDGSCASIWGQDAIENEQILGIVSPEAKSGAHCSVSGGPDVSKPLVIEEFVDVYEAMRWFALPEEVLHVHIHNS